jgi:hypothetical protein
MFIGNKIIDHMVLGFKHKLLVYITSVDLELQNNQCFMGLSRQLYEWVFIPAWYFPQDILDQCAKSVVIFANKTNNGLQNEGQCCASPTETTR